MLLTVFRHGSISEENTHNPRPRSTYRPARDLNMNCLALDGIEFLEEIDKGKELNRTIIFVLIAVRVRARHFRR